MRWVKDKIKKKVIRTVLIGTIGAGLTALGFSPEVAKVVGVEGSSLITSLFEE